MSNIRDWLAAQLDRDELIARAAAAQFAGDRVGPAEAVDNSTVAHGGYGYLGDELANHIAEHDPARALRHVAAGRRILDRHAECGDLGWCDDGNKGWEERRAAGGPGCAEIADLASIYAHRDGYDPAWSLPPVNDTNGA